MVLDPFAYQAEDEIRQAKIQQYGIDVPKTLNPMSQARVVNKRIAERDEREQQVQQALEMRKRESAARDRAAGLVLARRRGDINDDEVLAELSSDPEAHAVYTSAKMAEEGPAPGEAPYNIAGVEEPEEPVEPTEPEIVPGVPSPTLQQPAPGAPPSGVGGLGGLGAARRDLRRAGEEYRSEIGQTKEDLAAAQEQRQRAIDMQTMARTVEREEKAAALADRQEEINKWQQQQDRADSIYKDKRQEAMGKFREFEQAVAEKREGFDPGRLYKGWKNTAVATLAMALSEMGRVIQGTNAPNLAKAAIDAAVERDVEKQIAEVEAAEGKVEGAKNAYALLREQFGDDQMARDALRSNIYKNYAALNDSIGATHAGAIDQAKSEELSAQLRMEAVGQEANLDAKVHDSAVKQAQSEFSMSAQTQQLAMQKAAASAKGDGYRIKGYMPTGETTINEKTFGKAVELAAGVSGMQSNIDKLVKLKKKVGSGSWGRGDKKEAGLYINKIIGKMSQINATGVLSNTEYKRYVDLLSNPTNFLDMGFEGSVRGLKNTFITGPQDVLENAYGWVPQNKLAMQQLGAKKYGQ